VRQDWLDAELKQVFTLSSEEKNLIQGKSKSYQILFLSLYKACQKEKIIPNDIPIFSPNVNAFIAEQLAIDPTIEKISGRSKRRLFQELREALNFRKLSAQEKENLIRFLAKEVLVEDHHPDVIRERLQVHLEKNHLAFPSEEEEGEIIRSAQYAFEKEFFGSIFQKLPEKFQSSIDAWLDFHV